MCGIAGVFHFRGGEVPRELLLDMAGELAHRGPDGTGLYRDGNLGMVNTRLSIVDLAGGDQPIPNEDGRYWVVQNGEIFNYVELRAELIAAGHRFTTTCDTEVLVHAFEEWGSGFLDRLNGEFAVAIWDRRERRLLLARDRFGIRPLFMAEVGDSFVFGSEAKALLRHPALERALDPVALLDTFTLWTTAPERSIFQGIRELAPGSRATIDRDGKVTLDRWWTLPFTRIEPDGARSEADFVEEVGTLLADAIRLRLRADVPVGVYLSGGLDSSGIAAGVRHRSTTELVTFAVRFADPRFDEREHQDRMAAAIGTELRHVTVDAAEIAALMPDVVWHGEQPTVRTAPAPLLALSRLVRSQGYKVVLTGEGADEVFAGYDLFREDKVRRFWAKAPESRCRPLLLGRIYPFLAHSLGRAGAMRTRFFAQGLTRLDDPLYSHRIRFANTSRIAALMEPEVVTEANSVGTAEDRLLERLGSELLHGTPLKRAQQLEASTFLEGYLLHTQGDRMLMGNAIEGRFPYLDYRLAEVAARVPDRYLIAGLREKSLLRKVLAPLLPPAIARRVKHPYRAPILDAFVGPDAPEYVTTLTAPERVAETGLFAREGVALLMEKCRTRRHQGVSETDEMALVGVLSLQLLHEQFVRRPRLAARAIPNREVVGDRVVQPNTAPGPP
ncbi:MAG: asparagine synthase (glutamine-hydrolyzing) [Polyangiaceae bacterium]|nr:asparagine synthase (glutamine-hydrolyzing) [Polyangiaceae bacterium]